MCRAGYRQACCLGFGVGSLHKTRWKNVPMWKRLSIVELLAYQRLIYPPEFTRALKSFVPNDCTEEENALYLSHMRSESEQL